MALGFCRKQNKNFSILTETHIYHDQIHYIRNSSLGPIFFSPGDSHTKRLLALLHSCLEGVTDVDTDPKRLLPLMTELSVFMPLQSITPGNSWIVGIPLKDYKFYRENKSEWNENKLILGEFNCTMDKMDRDVGNKTQRLYRCSNYALSKLIVDNGLEDLWRKENTDSSEFTCWDRSFGKRSRTDRVYTDIKAANNTKINHIMVSFTDYYSAISLDRISSKNKTGKY